jgi:hypothetical protein
MEFFKSNMCEFRALTSSLQKKNINVIILINLSDAFLPDENSNEDLSFSFQDTNYTISTLKVTYSASTMLASFFIHPKLIELTLLNLSS